MGFLDGLLGGGSGGGGGGLGSILDPLGLESGQNGGGMLGSLIDPLGIIGGLEKGLNSMVGNKNPTGAAGSSQISQLAQQMLGQQQVQQFGASANSGSCDPAQNAATTELPPNAQSPGGFSGGQIQSSSSAATGITDAQQAWLDSPEGRSLNQIAASFALFEDRGAFQSNDPNQISAQSLSVMANSPDSANQAAALWLLQNPQVLNELEMLSGGNGNFSRQALQAYISSKLNAAGNPPQSNPPPPASNPPPPSSPHVSPTASEQHCKPTQVAQNVNNPYAQALANATSTGSSSASSSTASGASSASSSTASSNPYYGLNTMTYDQIENEANNLMSKKSLTEDDYKRLQALMQQRQEMFQMLSNIQTMLHDMSMAAINNMNR